MASSALAGLLVLLGAVAVLGELREVHELGESSTETKLPEQGEDLGEGLGPKIARGFLERYYPDGRNEGAVWATLRHPKLRHPTTYGPGDDLGEGDEALLRALSSRKQHQKLEIMPDPKGKVAVQCIHVYPSAKFTANVGGISRTTNLYMGGCSNAPGFYYNRFTKRLEMEQQPGEDIMRCIGREPFVGEERRLGESGESEKQVAGFAAAGDTFKETAEPTAILQDCNHGPDQVWNFEPGEPCDAFHFEWGDLGPRVLSMPSVKNKATPYNPVITDRFYGMPYQRWNYREVVRHSRCRNKRYKTLKFDGTLETTITYRRFIGWPLAGVTVMFWVKMKRGKGAYKWLPTPFSYASDAVCPGSKDGGCPPFVTQIGLSFRGDTREAQIDLFDTQFQTGVKAGFDWMHLAVQWDRQSQTLLMWVDGEEKYRKMTNDPNLKRTKLDGASSTTEDFDELEFMPGGCLMLGQKAKKPCKERMAETSFMGHIADFLVLSHHRGSEHQAITKDEINEMMFKPVEPAYLASINDDNPKSAPDREKGALKLAYLTRQYGSQEFGESFPPTCELEPLEFMEEEDVADDYWAKKCKAAYTSDCELGTGAHGTGDVHYSTFEGCHWDDQAIGIFTAVAMKPKYFNSFPLTIQYMTTPVYSTPPWANTPTERTVYDRNPNGGEGTAHKMWIGGQLSYVSGVAMKFGNEFVAEIQTRGGIQVKLDGVPKYAFGGGSAGTWGKISSTGVVTEKNCDSYCTLDDVVFGGNFRPNYFYVTLVGHGIGVSHERDRIWFPAFPRKLAGKFGGVFGNMHKSDYNAATPDKRTTFEAGWNEHASRGNNLAFKCDRNGGVDGVAANWPRGTCGGGGWDRGGCPKNVDCKPIIAGKPIEGLKNAGCPGGYVMSDVPNPFNGNAPWKGVKKWMISWRVNNNIDGNKIFFKPDGAPPTLGTIPNIWGRIRKKLMDYETSTGILWEWASVQPPGGTQKNKPTGANEAATKACSSLLKWKKNFKGCTDDYNSIGDKAVEKNRLDTEAQAGGTVKLAGEQDVRDVSGFQFHGKWVAQPSWGCVDEFAGHITAMYKKRAQAKHKANKLKELCTCRNKWPKSTGNCAYDHFICIADIQLDNPDKYGLLTSQERKRLATMKWLLT